MSVCYFALIALTVFSVNPAFAGGIRLNCESHAAVGQPAAAVVVKAQADGFNSYVVLETTAGHPLAKIAGRHAATASSVPRRNPNAMLYVFNEVPFRFSASIPAGRDVGTGVILQNREIEGINLKCSARRS